MRYTLNKQPVSVYFSYEFKPGKEQKGPGHRTSTTCVIKAVKEGEKPEQWPIIGTGVAKRHWRDIDNKFDARKLAAQRALANAGIDRPSRSEFWKQYFASVLTPWKKAGKRAAARAARVAGGFKGMGANEQPPAK